MREYKSQLKLNYNRYATVYSYFAESPKDVDLLLDQLDGWLDKQEPKDSIVGFDTETTGLTPESEEVEVRLLQFGFQVGDDDFDSYLFDAWSLSLEQVERIGHLLASRDVIKVGQNLKFDIKFWKKFYHSTFPYGFRFGKLFDTELAGKILTFGLGRAGQFNLKYLAESWLGLDLPKEEALSDWSRPILFDSQLEYAGADAVVPLLLRSEMLPVIEENHLQKACKNDFDTVEPVAKLEYDGLLLNTERWIEEYHKTEGERDKLEIEIQEMLPSGQPKLFEDVDAFNISSTKQLAGRLALQGVALPLTPKGNPSRDAGLLHQIEDEHEVIPKLIYFAKLEKLLTAYGLGWLEDVNHTTKRVHASFTINGAIATSRFSSFNPNLQQIPRGDSRRSCFEAADGNILIGADYSQIELRILAQFSRDPIFISGFTSGEDFHTWTASQVFERDIEDVTKDQREFAKRLNFGLVYGIGAGKLGVMLGIEESEAQELMDAYFEKFARTAAYLNEAAHKTIRFKKSYTSTGRFVKYVFDRSNRKMSSAVGRNGKNMPIQGTSAELLKRALQYIFDEIYNDEPIKLVNIVHDEIILEAPEERQEEVGEILQKAMIRAGEDFIDLLPVKVDVSFMKIWKK